MYLRHEAKLEQSERQAFYLINLIISLAFKIHLRHRNASQSSSLVTWKSQDALTCKLKGVYTPITLTFLALPHLQPGTMFWWNRNLDLKRKTSQLHFFSKCPQTKVSHCRLLQADLSDLRYSLHPSPNNTGKEELALKAKRYFNITDKILRGLLSTQSYSKLRGHRESFSFYMKHVYKAPHHVRHTHPPS